MAAVAPCGVCRADAVGNELDEVSGVGIRDGDGECHQKQQVGHHHCHPWDGQQSVELLGRSCGWSDRAALLLTPKSSLRLLLSLVVGHKLWTTGGLSKCQII